MDSIVYTATVMLSMQCGQHCVDYYKYAAVPMCRVHMPSVVYWSPDVTILL